MVAQDFSLEKDSNTAEEKICFYRYQKRERAAEDNREFQWQRLLQAFHKLPLSALGRWVVKCSDSYKFKSYLLLTQNVFVSLRHINPCVTAWEKKGKAAEAGTHRCLVNSTHGEGTLNTPAKTMVVHCCQTFKHGLQPFTYPVHLCLSLHKSWRN